MRQLLAVAFLGATLGFGVGSALASDTVDYVPPYQRTQSESVASRTVIGPESRESFVAGGGDTATSVYRQLREVNMEGGKGGR